MAVGKGSMERAAKAAEPSKTAKTTKGRKAAGNKAAEQPVSEAPAAEVQTAEAPAAEQPVPEAAKAEAEMNGQIVYQKSSGMLERSARPNEQFGLGDAMPVYYF